MESPGSKRTCPLWTTQQNPLSQHPPKPNSSTGSSPHPQTTTLPQSPAHLLPSPGISTVARRPPRPTLNTPSAGFHVNMQLKESHRPQAGHHGCPIRPPPAISSSISSSPLLLVSPVVCCPACPSSSPVSPVCCLLLFADPRLRVTHAHTISPFSSLLASRSKPLSAI